jgi:hypothetical protein
MAIGAGLALAGVFFPATAPIILPFVVEVMSVVPVVGGVSGVLVSNLTESEIWKERTERRSYKAPDGHVIFADPTF